MMLKRLVLCMTLEGEVADSDTRITLVDEDYALRIYLE
jgi:hypothetical protein